MKRIFSILLVAIMLFSTLAIGTQAQEVTTESSQNKLTDELKSYLETVENDEYVPIYIWLNEQNEEMVYAVLSKTLGMTVTKNSEEAYIERKASAKAELLSKGLENLAKTPEYSLQARATGTIDIVNLTPDVFKAQANIPEIMTNDEIKNCIESGMTSDEIINLSERTQFLSDFRMARKSLNNATNEQFYKLLDLDKCKNVYLDPLLARVTLKCKKSYIEKFEDAMTVKEIGLAEKVEFSDHSNSTISNIVNDETMRRKNYGYNGAGIRIGILEFSEKDERGKYGVGFDSENPHLGGNIVDGGQIIYRENPFFEDKQTKIATHGSAVLAIVGGNTYQNENGFYEGIAYGADKYYTHFTSEDNKNGTDYLYDFKKSMSWLINDSNVSVINMSFGTINNYGYRAIDNLVDCYVEQYRVVIVASAGNNGNVSSPATAYNSIAVGNMSYEKDSRGLYKIYAFDTEHQSAYVQYTALSNKPDISAFGTNIVMYGSNLMPSHKFSVDDPESESVTGTSFAAPMVTGAIALMLQANSNLIGKPDAIKAILMASASDNVSTEGNQNTVEGSLCEISTNDITGETSLLRRKTGAGLLNILGAINLAICNRVSSYSIDVSELDTYTEFESDSYYFESGTCIKLGLVYEKASHKQLTYKNQNGTVVCDEYGVDFDIQIVNENGEVLLETNSSENNVELIKCQFSNSGWYRFRIKCKKNDIETQENLTFYDENGNLLTHTEHTAINLSMIFSCACDTPSLYVESYWIDNHYLGCESCYFRCKENHQYLAVQDKSAFADYGVTVYHEIEIKTDNVLGNLAPVYCVYNTPYVHCNTSGMSAYAIRESFSNGENWGLIQYKIYIVQNNVQMATFFSNVYFEMDTESGEVSLTIV